MFIELCLKAFYFPVNETWVKVRELLKNNLLDIYFELLKTLLKYFLLKLKLLQIRCIVLLSLFYNEFNVSELVLDG